MEEININIFIASKCSKFECPSYSMFNAWFWPLTLYLENHYVLPACDKDGTEFDGSG